VSPKQPRELVVRLATPDELVGVDPRGVLFGAGRLHSGLEELADRLLAQRKAPRGQRIVFELATGAGSAGLAGWFERAVRRYGQLRIEESRRQQAISKRQGMASLLSGSMLFFVGVVLSYWFTRPDSPEFWQELLGNGVFLVVAWVGLWYPLDMLFISRQPLKREVRVLSTLARMPVEVRAVTVPAVPGPRPPWPPPGTAANGAEDAAAGNATAGDSTTGDATAGDATAGDATAGDSTTGNRSGAPAADPG
jgi:hypothetical protein